MLTLTSWHYYSVCPNAWEPCSSTAEGSSDECEDGFHQDSDYDFYDENPEWDSGFWERTWLLDEFDQTEPATVDGAPLPSLAYSHVRPTHVLRHFR